LNKEDLLVLTIIKGERKAGCFGFSFSFLFLKAHHLDFKRLPLSQSPFTFLTVADMIAPWREESENQN